MLGMNNVNFKPWIGEKYEDGLGNSHYKVLVLGESHYCRDLAKGKCSACSLKNCVACGYSEEDWRGQTIEYIDGILNHYQGKRYQQTALCFERAFNGKVLSDEERKDFWNHVVFYNYIQKCLAKEGNSRTTFTTEDIENAEEAFREVLEELMPDRIIVWGVRLYYTLPDWGGRETEIDNEEGNETKAWIYQINGKEIKAMMVHHPSTPTGKKRDYWYSFYNSFMND